MQGGVQEQQQCPRPSRPRPNHPRAEGGGGRCAGGGLLHFVFLNKLANLEDAIAISKYETMNH